MKKKETAVRLQLNRETLRALEQANLTVVLARQMQVKAASNISF
jgi:hypothetical protein